MSSPRPASAVPKPSRLRCEPRRAFTLKVLKTSSISTGSGVACEAGIVSPAEKPSSDSPGVISTYFRPSAERGRMIIVESTGSGSTFFSSFSSTSAVGAESPSPATGVISETAPTRWPPIRTSLPTTRFAALLNSALRSYVGTNGRPLFAL
jgi:hypothetical protein